MAKILVVDDELFYRELASDILKRADYEVVLATNGKEAIDAITKRRDFDVILSDVVMPDMNGLVLLSRVEKLDPTLPVILLSAHEDHKIVLQALKRGAFDYQKKPISQQELLHSIQRALQFRAFRTEQQNKLARLANLENGARRLSELVVGDLSFAAIAREFEFLESAIKMVAQMLECERVSIMLFNPETHRLEVAVSIGLSVKMIKEENKPSEKSVSGHVLETGEAVLVKDLASDERFHEGEYAAQYKTKSFIVAPVRVGDKMVGTINVNDKKNKAAFDEDDLFMLKTMSHHVSAALSHAIHESQIKRDRERLARLSELRGILINYLDPQEMLTLLLKRCQEMLNVVSAAVFLKDEASNELVLYLGFNADVKIDKRMAVPIGRSITGLTAEKAKIFLLNAPEKDRRYDPDLEWPFRGAVRSLLAAPLRLGNQTIGVIRLLNRRDGGFVQEDATLLKDVADSLSIAIRNLKLYEQLNHSVEEIINKNRDLQRVNEELELKVKELEALKRRLAAGGR